MFPVYYVIVEYFNENYLNVGYHINYYMELIELQDADLPKFKRLLQETFIFT